MKKIVAWIGFVCILIFMAGCAAGLPDPLPDIEAFYTRDIKSIEGETARQMLDRPVFITITDGDDRVAGLYRDFVAAYLDDIQFSPNAETVYMNKSRRTAAMDVEISVVNMRPLLLRAQEAAQARHDTILNTGHMPSERDDDIFLLEALLDILAAGGAERISGPQTVQLKYEKAGWTITNAEELIGSYLW